MITRAHVISSPDDNDIILGKKASNAYKTHPGNQKYRAIVDGAKQQYNSYPKRSDIRTNFPSCVMNAIRGQGYRFVVLNDEDKFVIPSVDIIESAIHTLEIALSINAYSFWFSISIALYSFLILFWCPSLPLCN
jgi:hypothetical protein